MNNKILFLDIDGVLNSRVYYKYLYKPENGNSRFDPYCVILVKKLVDEFNLKVVITSTWRVGSLNRLKKELDENNFTEYLHDDWLTPVARPPNRGKEIELWLKIHSDVKEYLILDDNHKLFDYQMTKFIQTSTYLGMVQDSYNQARILLQSYNQPSIIPEENLNLD